MKIVAKFLRFEQPDQDVRSEEEVFVGLCVCWFVCLLVCMSVGLYVCWFVRLLACVSVGLGVCWFVRLLVCVSVGIMSIGLYVC